MAKACNKKVTWPLQIQVGDLVHPTDITSPDVGEVLQISKARKTCKVRWRSSGTHRAQLESVASVCRSLTSLVSYERGKIPCARCGYPRSWYTETDPPKDAPCKTCAWKCTNDKAQP